MEKVSVLMDGELDSDEAARQIARIKQDSSLREGWETWHLIGDTLRGSRDQPLSARFSEQLSQRLALEPTVLAPRLRTPKKMQTYALSAAASVAAVAVVGWMALSTQRADQPAVLATGEAPATIRQVAVTPVAVESQPYNGHMHEYLLAHQGISPSTAIQGVAPYIRTVSGVSAASGLR